MVISKRNLVIYGSLAAIVQYVLLNSHKVGGSHWFLVFLFSALFFWVGALLSARCFSSQPKIGRLIFASFSFLNALLAPSVYLTLEMQVASTAVRNTLHTDGWLFLRSVFFLSGGWLYSLALLGAVKRT